MTSDMFRAAFVAFVAAFASFAAAQGPLNFVTLERDAELEAFVRFGQQVDDCSSVDDQEDIEESTVIGFFNYNDQVDASGGGASATASAFTESTVRSDRIEIFAEVTADVSLGNGCVANASTGVDLTTTFTVDEVTQAALTGRIAAELPTGIDTSGYAPFAIVTLIGFSPTGGFLNVSAQIGAFTGSLEREIFEPITLYPDAEYALAIGGSMLVGVDDDGGPTSAAPATTFVDVALALGDNDEDGLLDVWETFGIDVDEDGTPELDFPAMGADPDRKDLFVEIDVMSGFTPDPNALADVRAAFANVPGNLISNPDGSSGITLHTIIDETNLPVTQYPAPPGHYAALSAIKGQRFGTPAERAGPLWEAIKAARLVTFRYCVWGGTRAPNGTTLGFGEIVGDDFVVLAGALDAGGTRDEQAGVFMHEFGHNLGLRHGGADNINFKPNYISVMNYALAIPSAGFPSEIRDSWRLDYSRRVLPDIDELNYDEIDGFGLLGAPELAGRFTLVQFPTPTPNDPLAARSLAAPLDQSPFDVNSDGDTSDFGVVDVNNDKSGDLLVGFNDWRSLRLPLAGSENFGDAMFGAGEDTDEIPGGSINLDVLDEIASNFEPDGPTPCNIADLVPPFGITDLDDIDAFIPLFLVADPGADFVPPVGIVDLDDLDAFIAAFLAGCP